MKGTAVNGTLLLTHAKHCARFVSISVEYEGGGYSLGSRATEGSAASHALHSCGIL